MTRLPLQKLPLLAFDKIVRLSDPMERIMLSFCSKKTKRMIWNLNIRVSTVSVATHEFLDESSHNIPNISISSTEGTHFLFYSLSKFSAERPEIDQSERRLVLEFNSFNDEVVRLWTLNSQDQRIFVDSSLPMKQCIMALLDIVFELFIPNIVSWCQIAQYDVETIKDLCELVHLPRYSAPEIEVRNIIKLDRENRFQILLDNIGTVDRFMLHCCVHDPRDDESRYSPRFNNVFRFKHVEYSYADWVSENLTEAMNGCETITLWNTSLSGNHINQFIKSWRAHGKEQLREFVFFFHWDLEEESAFSEVPTLKVVKEGRPTYYILSKPEANRTFDLAVIESNEQLRSKYTVSFTTSGSEEHAEMVSLIRTLLENVSLKEKLVTINKQIADMRSGLEKATKGSDWEGNLTRVVNQLQLRREEYRTEFRNSSQQLEGLPIRVVGAMATLEQ